MNTISSIYLKNVKIYKENRSFGIKITKGFILKSRDILLISDSWFRFNWY